VDATLLSLSKDGVFALKFRHLIFCSVRQCADVLARWQREGSMNLIGRVFDRQSSTSVELSLRSTRIIRASLVYSLMMLSVR